MQSLLIFGDSVLKGVICDQGRYRLCEGHDFSSLEEKGIRVQNHAKMGATITQGLELLRRKLETCGRDTKVLLSFGGNDCDYDWQKISENPEGSYLPATPRDRFVEQYRQAIRLVRERGGQVLLTSILPLDTQRYFKTICRDRNQENILRWLGDVEHLYRWQEYYNSLVCSLASAFGCPIVDLRGSFLPREDYPGLISEDGIHPSQKGHELIRGCIESALRWR